MNYYDIAKSVLRTAASLDHRIDSWFAGFDNGTQKLHISTWARVFENKTWPQEAVEAVFDHYSKPNAFRIMPGDIVDYCARQPIWSSPDHVISTFRRYAVEQPFSLAFEHYSGVRPPQEVYDVGAADRAAASRMVSEWLESNLDEIVASVIKRQTASPRELGA